MRFASPQARGDSISKYAFPVIGTIDEMFSKFEWLQNAGSDSETRAPLEFAEGGPWAFSYDDLNTLSEQPIHLPTEFSSATISFQMLMLLETPDGMQHFSHRLTNLFVT